MSRFLLDTAVFIYARGREDSYREPCLELLRHCRDGSLVAEASVEAVQEFGHILRRRGLDGRTVREEALAMSALCRLHDFGQPELRLALSLVAAVPALGMRDAVHAATALRRDVHVVVSSDRGFDQVPGLERVDPIDAVGRLLRTPPDSRQPG